MTPSETDPMLAEIRRRADRAARWRRDGDLSVARRLAQIGVLGWITIIPMLVAILAGRWLDAQFESGIFWTAPLLMLGTMLGCWSAWRWIRSA